MFLVILCPAHDFTMPAFVVGQTAYRQWCLQNEDGSITLVGEREKNMGAPYAPPGASKDDCAEVCWQDGYTWKVPTLKVAHVQNWSKNALWQGKVVGEEDARVLVKPNLEAETEKRPRKEMVAVYPKSYKKKKA